ncbi:hypothetical protein L1987_46318 [Smallanthus sonchifolius]|uniref:Uncharacterized protein n=1 Tax=Smallanthus sonchifolius TaxID=185202 RepID=A0ACB9G157_9ASTR|nr:hypothetical protein L1987_46318 [Smallanthus sonchifolius]
MELEVISKENIKPSSPTPHHLKTFNLSILDQLITTPYIPVILYYPNHNGNNVLQALERSVLLKKSLSKTLTQFFPLAGTTKDHLSVECNDVGANYVLALVHGRCDDFLRQPDHQFMNRFLPIEPSFDGSNVGAPVTNVQVNIFKCGGIAIEVCISHNILDGAAFHTFLKGWANMGCGSEVIYPNLTASSIFPANSLWLRDISKVFFESLLKHGKCSMKRFVFDSNAIAALKAEATRNGVQQPTKVEVVSALIWKCAVAASCGFNNTSTLTHAVNLRRKLATKSSTDFIGNMIWISTAVCQASNELTLHGLVKKVRESIAKVDFEFVNKAQGDDGHVAMQKSLKENGKIGSIGGELLAYASLDPSALPNDEVDIVQPM